MKISALAQVRDADVDGDFASVESFTDLERLTGEIVSASRAGRVEPDVVAHFHERLVERIGGVEEPIHPNLITAQLTAESLEGKLGQVRARIERARAEATELEGRLGATLARIDAKTTRVNQLVAQRSQYQDTLRRKKDDRRMLLIFAAFGAFGAASRAVGLGSALSMSQLEDTIRGIDREIEAANREKLAIDAERRSFVTKQAASQRELEALRKIEKSITARIEALPDLPDDVPHRVAVLARELDENRMLAKNLEAQVVVLRSMNGDASAHERRLDALIEALEAEIASLRERNEAASQELLGTVVDIVFAEARIDPNLRIGPLSFSKKMLLLEGVDHLRLSFHRQVATLVDRMVEQGLTDAAGSRAIAAILMARLRGDPDVLGAVRRHLTAEALDRATPAQRLLLDALLSKRPPNLDALLPRVLAARVSNTAAREAAAALDRDDAEAFERALDRD